MCVCDLPRVSKCTIILQRKDEEWGKFVDLGKTELIPDRCVLKVMLEVQSNCSAFSAVSDNRSQHIANLRGYKATKGQITVKEKRRHQADVSQNYEVCDELKEKMTTLKERNGRVKLS